MTRGWPIMATPVMLESPRRVVEGAVAAMKSKGEGGADWRVGKRAIKAVDYIYVNSVADLIHVSTNRPPFIQFKAINSKQLYKYFIIDYVRC
jgi:hypothetical protein